MGRPASLKKRLGGPARAVLRASGYDLVRLRSDRPEPLLPPDFDEAVAKVVAATKPFTLTSPERVFALCSAVRYLVEAEVPGAIVECGVWRGGSMMAAAMTLVAAGCDDRDLYLFDTFTTMPPPADRDVDCFGTPAAAYFEGPGNALDDPAYAYLPLEGVREVVRSTGYPAERLHFVAGMIEDTVPDRAPEEISLLRLDTDWYASTAHEMAHLFPRIVGGGVLIVDDYGHFRGAREAVDEHLRDQGVHLLLNRIDATGRMAVVGARR